MLDETGRVIPAREFMPQLENTPIGRELDCVALEMGLRTLTKNPDIRLSINMSARSIGLRAMVTCAGAVSEAKDANIGERLILGNLGKLGHDGARAGDRFHGPAAVRAASPLRWTTLGPAISAFAIFASFSFDAAKIDGQFIRGIGENRDNQALVRALIAVAREFEILVTAESVETQAGCRIPWCQRRGLPAGVLFGAPRVTPRGRRKSANIQPA